MANTRIQGAAALFAIAVFLILGSTILPAQDQSEPAKTAPTPKFPDVLDKGTLETKVFLRDENGTLMFVPNYSIEDFARDQDQAIGTVGSEFAPFEFKRIHVTAHVDEQSASVRGTFRVRLGPNARSAEIPLSFGTCLTGLDPPKVDSEGTDWQLLADSRGYRWILVLKTEIPEEQSDHSITLSGKSRVTSEGDRKTLRIALPPHPCLIHIRLPANAIDERFRTEDVAQREITDGGVELTINSRGGDFHLSWRSQEAVRRVASVEAHSTTIFELDDPRQMWKSTTNVTVRWSGTDASDQFRIRLPDGARWRAYPQPDSEYGRFTVTRVDPILTADGEQDSRGTKSTGEDVATENVASNVIASNVIASNVIASDVIASDDVGSAEQPVELLIENLDPSQTQTIELLLEWEWAPQSVVGDPQVVNASIPVPSVVGVNYHRGTVDCTFPASYSIVFTEGEGTQIQVGRVPDVFSRQQLHAVFSQEPFDLSVTFRRDQSLPIVRPTYRVSVDANKLVMTAWLECSFNANRQVEIGMDFGDWILQENSARALAGTLTGAGDLFTSVGDALDVQLRDDGSYAIAGIDPEPGSSGSNRPIVQIWRLVAERNWTPNEQGQLDFQIPRVIRGRTVGASKGDHGAGTLIVTSDENILLQWQELHSTGLLHDSFSTENKKYVDKQSVRSPLAYRFQSGETTPSWTGKAELLPQALTVQEEVVVEILESEVATTQDFSLQVANVPLSQVQVEVRADASIIAPQFYVNDRVTSAQVVARVDRGTPTDNTAEDLPSAAVVTVDSEPRLLSLEGWNVYELSGAPELLGNHQLRVVTSISWKQISDLRAAREADRVTADETLAPESLATRLELPLARLRLPPTTHRLRRTAQIQGDFDLQTMEVATEPGTITFDSVGEVRTLRPEVEVIRVGVLAIDEQQSAAPIRITQSWLQSAITRIDRQDRFVAQIESQVDQIDIQLPTLAAMRGSLQVLIDGVVTGYEYHTESDTVVVRLPANRAGVGNVTTVSPNAFARHTIELLYSVRTNLSSLTVLDISAPRIDRAEHTGRFYWQLATPATQHLGLSPSELTPEWRWQWGGFWWFRKSAREDSSLATLLGATHREPLPPSLNQYVLSGRNPAGSFRVWIVSRRVLWFPIGTLSIAIAVLVINVPFFRKPTCGFVLAGLIGTFGMIFPDLGVLLGQTAVISLGLVALVFATQAAIESRVRRRSVFTTRPSTYVDGSGQFSVARSVRVHAPTETGRGSSIASEGGN